MWSWDFAPIAWSLKQTIEQKNSGKHTGCHCSWSLRSWRGQFADPCFHSQLCRSTMLALTSMCPVMLRMRAQPAFACKLAHAHLHVYVLPIGYVMLCIPYVPQNGGRGPREPRPCVIILQWSKRENPLIIAFQRECHDWFFLPFHAIFFYIERLIETKILMHWYE